MSRRMYLFSLLLVCFGFCIAQKPAASSKVPAYIMHKVKFGETLTKIGKQYDVSVNDILKSNPSLSNSIMPDQIIRIPNVHNKKLATEAKNTVDELKPISKTALTTKNAKTHIVQKGETLYYISKLYDVKVDDLIKWNSIQDNTIGLGSVLYLTAPAKTEIIKSVQDIIIQSNDNHPVIKINETVNLNNTINSESQNIEEEEPDIQASFNESQNDLASKYKKHTNNIDIKGTGAPMTTTLGAMETVYFAMHRTLAIGTVIKVKNLVNNKIVYAKIIGKLPDTDENKNIIIRYTLGVKKDLQLQNGKCYIQVSYPE